MVPLNNHQLTPADRFLVLATDGLWDSISPAQAARTLSRLLSSSPSSSTRLSDVNASPGNPIDCPATRLLRRALTSMPAPLAKAIATKRHRIGKTDSILSIQNVQDSTEMEEGEEDDDEEALKRASALLSLPAGVARFYRDDITVLVLELELEKVAGQSFS
ncbi:unnamed protein product [Protopolystoma xenopodis]|uniref:PPM-type phosphatase domain-containing protein n=1 Tax=Protopolystoma xenopodis TaxID=117903 RepID=A0A3S5AJD1_9PLAT|nr:unnamed protein product [Protopolystoma xenopodis]